MTARLLALMLAFGVMTAPGAADTRMVIERPMDEQRAERFVKRYEHVRDWGLTIDSVRVVSWRVAHVSVWDPGFVEGSEVRVPLTVRLERGRVRLYNPLMFEWWPTAPR